MRLIISFIFLAQIGILAAAPRIAIFSEPGFPNASQRDADFYLGAVDGSRLSLSQLERLSDFDIVIFPHGGYLPAAAEIPVGELLSRGGTAIITGDLQTPPPPGGLDTAGPLEFDRLSGQWLVRSKGAGYNLRVASPWFPEFDLKGWPNYAQSYARPYMRSFDETITVNPILKSSLPATFYPPTDKAIHLARLVPNNLAGDYAFDVFIPLYQFNNPSGNPYSPYKEAGKSEEDRAADAFIYRRFRPTSFGGTLVVMGQIGRLLLESEAGAEAIQEVIRLATDPLPGEFDRGYVRTVLALEKTMADYNDLNQSLHSALARAAVKRSAEQETFLRSMKQNIREFNRFNNAFEALQVLKNNRKTIAQKQLDELTGALRTAIWEKQKELEKKLPIAPLIDHGDARHPYGQFVFTASDFGPWNPSQDSLWSKIREIGITNPALHGRDWYLYRQLNEKYGFATAYRFWYIERGHADKQRVSSGIYDPNTGSVKPASISVFSKEAPQFDREVIPILKEVNENPGVSIVVHGEERDMQWSLWCSWMQEKFIGYLKHKYDNDIAGLNREYSTVHVSFEEITLPLKRPETQSEHALWEDWTRYREIYRIEYELEHRIGLVKKHAPSAKQWVYGSYHLQGRYPANGINYYEFGKLLDPACLESGSLSPWKEVIAFDITAFNKKHVNTEWADFYFPAGSHRDSIHRMRQSLWNEANCGTVGWFLYMGGVQSRERYHHSVLITPGGHIQPVGHELRNLTRDFHAARSLFLDGWRAEPEVRFVYSPTTRRHTSWPGIEEDRSLQSTTGWNEACKRLHIPARAVDEQAIMEGKLPKECRFLVLPRVEYLNRDLYEQLKDFMEQGGTLVATADSGRFDEYGHRKNLLTRMAGLRVLEHPHGMFPEFRFEILFPQETSALMHQEDAVLATLTPLGKGRLILIGKEPGQLYNATGKGLEDIDGLLSDIGVKRPFRCSDQNLVVRPWIFNGETFLACHYLYRANITREDGGFPLASPPAMVEFDLELAGHFKVEDWLVGVKLTSSLDNGITTAKALIENPGGKIFRLIPQEIASATNSLAPAAIKPETEDISPKQTFQLPCSARFFAEWGQIQLGDGILVCESENEGAWLGKVFASLTRGNQTLRRECRPGERIWFHFTDKTIVFDCSATSAVMPVHATGRFSESPLREIAEGCLLTDEKHSLVLQNSHLHVKILPGFGGRIAELRSSAEAPNQLLIRPAELAKGIGPAYRDYGGLEYTPGKYQGPGWGIQYDTEILSNTPEKISVLLKRSAPVSIPNGPTIAYEILYSLEKDSSMLKCVVRMYNEGVSATALQLTTHPLFQIGGDVNFGDNFYWISDKGLGTGLFKPGRNEYLPNRSDWFAYIDARAGSGVLQTFPADALPRLYAWTGNQAYNVELPFSPVDTQPGKYAEFPFSIGVLNGFNAISGHDSGLLAELTADTSQLTLRIGATSRRQVTVQCRILRDGQTIHEFKPEQISLTPGIATARTFEWNSTTLPDATYVFEATCDSIRFQHEIRIDRSTEKAKEHEHSARILQLRNLQLEYQQNPTPELRKKILNLAEE